jgi:hypothetical protein
MGALSKHDLKLTTVSHARKEVGFGHVQSVKQQTEGSTVEEFPEGHVGSARRVALHCWRRVSLQMGA